MNSWVLKAFSTAAMCAALAAAAPASATIVERGSFTDESYGFAYDCGFPVEVAGIASGHFRLREGKNADASAFFSLDNVSYREIHTNPLTGRWFSSHWSLHEQRDHRDAHRGVAVRVPEHQGRTGGDDHRFGGQSGGARSRRPAADDPVRHRRRRRPRRRVRGAARPTPRRAARELRPPVRRRSRADRLTRRLIGVATRADARAATPPAP